MIIIALILLIGLPILHSNPQNGDLQISLKFEKLTGDTIVYIRFKNIYSKSVFVAKSGAKSEYASLSRLQQNFEKVPQKTTIIRDDKEKMYLKFVIEKGEKTLERAQYMFTLTVGSKEIPNFMNEMYGMQENFTLFSDEILDQNSNFYDTLRYYASHILDLRYNYDMVSVEPEWENNIKYTVSWQEFEEGSTFVFCPLEYILYKIECQYAENKWADCFGPYASVEQCLGAYGKCRKSVAKDGPLKRLFNADLQPCQCLENFDNCLETADTNATEIQKKAEADFKKFFDSKVGQHCTTVNENQLCIIERYKNKSDKKGSDLMKSPKKRKFDVSKVEE